MKKATISVSEAARNFADCVNRVRYRDISFVLVKNGSPVARLGPYSPKICTGRDLAEALSTVRLSDAEAKAWRADMGAARGT